MLVSLVRFQSSAPLSTSLGGPLHSPPRCALAVAFGDFLQPSRRLLAKVAAVCLGEAGRRFGWQPALACGRRRFLLRSGAPYIPHLPPSLTKSQVTYGRQAARARGRLWRLPSNLRAAFWRRLPAVASAKAGRRLRPPSPCFSATYARPLRILLGSDLGFL